MVVIASDAIFTCVFFWVTKYLALLAHKAILKSIFKVVGLITNLQQSKLEIENLDHLIFIA